MGWLSFTCALHRAFLVTTLPTIRQVEIAELLGVPRQPVNTLVDEPGFPGRSSVGRIASGIGETSRRGRGVGGARNRGAEREPTREP